MDFWIFLLPRIIKSGILAPLLGMIVLSQFLPEISFRAPPCQSLKPQKRRSFRELTSFEEVLGSKYTLST